MGTGCFISPGRTLEGAVERVQLAESLGYEAVYTTHIAGFESLTALTTYALATQTIRVGTGVVPIYTRTPATMAQTAASIDALSGGRLTLGLGVSHQVVVEHWHGQSIDRPVAEMREYVTLVRAILRGEDPNAAVEAAKAADGKAAGDKAAGGKAAGKWRTSFRLAGLDPSPQLPIYVAALSPAMLRLAGEVADGVMLWLCNPSYIKDVVIPEVRAGRERAGRSLEGFDVVAAVPAALTEDVEQARARMRQELLPYFSLPFYRAMIERSGFGGEIEAFDAASGDAEAMKAAISDDFLAELAAIGDAEQVAAGMRRYRDAGASSPCAGPVGKADVEATLRAAIA